MPTQYNRIAIVLHWLLAIMISLSLFVGGPDLANIDNSDPEKLTALQGHAIFGVIVGLLMLLRFLNIKLRGHPDAANPPNTMANLAASVAHKGLYILVFAVIGSGIAMAVAVDLPAVINGTGVLPESFSHLTARDAHGVLTKLLALLIILHIAAALYHQFIVKDNLLRRMRFKRMD